MKKLFAFALLIASLSSCKKNSDTVATGSTDFSPLVKGTSWTYVRNSSDSAYKDSTYTFTVLDSTTIRSNKQYHVCSSSAGGNVYYALTDSGYFRAGSLLAGMGIPELATFEELYLSKSAAVGNTWSKILPITYQGTKYDLTLTYTIPSTGGTKTVLGKAYSNLSAQPA